MPLTEADRKLLLEHSRCVLERTARGQSIPILENAPAAVQVFCGAFVTLRPSHGELRGCMGRVLATAPLFQTVADSTVDAARHDSRFSPVMPHELAAIGIEISVLSAIEAARPEAVEVGRHGLIISLGARRGLLLPQVPVQWGWERERFLNETCLKAGLPREAWRHGAQIQVFTAEVFAEPHLRADEFAPAAAQSNSETG